jgi:hypothetical protein
MKCLLGLFVLLLLLMMSVFRGGLCSYADAAVLCANPSGSVFLRTQCSGNETYLDPVALGLVGPPGPQGPVGPQGSPGPQGPSGISGYEVVVHGSGFQTQPAVRVIAECPAGKKLVGGGVSTDRQFASTDQFVIEDSWPFTAEGFTPHWEAAARTQDFAVDAPWSLTAYAICVDVAP